MDGRRDRWMAMYVIKKDSNVLMIEQLGELASMCPILITASTSPSKMIITFLCYVMVLSPRCAQFSLLPWYTPTLSLPLPYNVSVEGPTFFHLWSFLWSRLRLLHAHGAGQHVPPSSVFPAHWPQDPEDWWHTDSILWARRSGGVFLHHEVRNVCFLLFNVGSCSCSVPRFVNSFEIDKMVVF